MDPPVFSIQPGPPSNTLPAGSLVLYVIALTDPDGYFHISWEWSADDDVYTTIAGYTGISLNGVAVSSANPPSMNSITPGYYRARVSNEGGEIVSGSVTFGVESPQ